MALQQLWGRPEGHRTVSLAEAERRSQAYLWPARQAWTVQTTACLLIPPPPHQAAEAGAPPLSLSPVRGGPAGEASPALILGQQLKAPGQILQPSLDALGHLLGHLRRHSGQPAARKVLLCWGERDRLTDGLVGEGPAMSPPHPDPSPWQPQLPAEKAQGFKTLCMFLQEERRFFSPCWKALGIFQARSWPLILTAPSLLLCLSHYPPPELGLGIWQEWGGCRVGASHCWVGVPPPLGADSHWSQLPPAAPNTDA